MDEEDIPMPVFDDTAKPEPAKPGYLYVKETHINHKVYAYSEEKRREKLANGIRWYLFQETPGESNGRNVLHMAAANGDRHFTTMICKEAAQMGRGVLQHMINLEDEDGFSPFYLLCQKGFHRDTAGPGGASAAPRPQTPRTALANTFAINGAAKQAATPKPADYDRGLTYQRG